MGLSDTVTQQLEALFDCPWPLWTTLLFHLHAEPVRNWVRDYYMRLDSGEARTDKSILRIGKHVTKQDHSPQVVWLLRKAVGHTSAEHRT